jgi:hypothetical protein
MKPIRITKRDMQCGRVYQEFMAIADSDIRAAHGEPHTRKNPSETAISLYSEVATQVEADSDEIAAQMEAEDNNPDTDNDFNR